MRLVCKFHQQHDSIILVLLKRTYGHVFQVFLYSPHYRSISFGSARGLEPSHYQYNVFRLYVHPFPP
jgi:hypothetical protein